jgi:hypothetical protein
VVDTDWMPKVRHVTGSVDTINAVWGGHTKRLGNFLACGGADKRVTIFRLDQHMEVEYSISCTAAVNAITGSERLLAYGLRSGVVLLWDLEHRRLLAQQLPPYASEHGRICALWMSPDSSHLVVVTDNLVETWVRTGDDGAAGGGEEGGAGLMLQLLHSFETPDVKTRFRGQHSLCGVASSFTWPRTRKNKEGKVVNKGDYIMAVGARDSVTLWSLTTGVVQEQLVGMSDTCNCVWMSPEGTLLATAGVSSKIMVWTLPDLALLHVLPASQRVWALWGDARILASAGADNMVTIRSIETGAVMTRLQRAGTVYALWGSSDLALLASGGRPSPDALSDPRAGGSVTVRHLKSKEVVCYVEGLHAACDTECMWTNGQMLAWAGVEFVTVMLVATGHVLADFGVQHVVMGVCMCELERGWVLAIAFRKSVVVLDIASGSIVKEWPCENVITCLRGTHPPPIPLAPRLPPPSPPATAAPPAACRTS